MKVKDVHIDFESSIAPWLGKTSKIVSYHLNLQFIEHGLDLSKEQFLVLKRLYDHSGNGLNQNELALLTFRDKSSLARLLAKMEKKKYIQRKQHEEDKRINQIYLTEEGREIFNESKLVLRKLIKTMEEGISEEEKKLLIDILKKVQFNFQQEKVGL